MLLLVVVRHVEVVLLRELREKHRTHVFQEFSCSLCINIRLLWAYEFLLTTRCSLLLLFWARVDRHLVLRLDAKCNLSTLLAGLGEPLLQFALHQLFQVLVAHTSLVIHVKRELSAVHHREFTRGKRTVDWALLRAWR